MRLLTAVMLAALAVPVGLAAAGEPVAITDAKDRQIVDAFLAHVANVPKTVSLEACKKKTAEECEGIIWTI
ncbi:MAG TPA: hypothetical protein PLP01_14000, partial [Phycisphaerae bacterium]|nr:hypothetical protein [Phycisphaerae bacterium]